jgi:type IV pilus assembly protein PilV
VEVLVAVALLSFALYALVAAHAAALRYSQMSHYRATAVLLAADLGERMRANLGEMSEAPVEGEGGAGVAPLLGGGFWAGDYDYTLDFQRQQTAVDNPSEPCTTVASRCTAAQIAAVDLAQWRQTVRRLLPAGAVYTQRDAARALMDLWVAWRESARSTSGVSDASDAMLAPPGECPEGLGTGEDGGIRCVHLRIGL